MSPNTTTPSTQPTKDETQTSSGGGGGGGGGGSGRKASILKPPEQTLKCPRCDSPNTKFCYYNNYSLTQPRYFCKTCRRYWTRGGALRNVPIGGGCRKNKKTRLSSSRFVNGDSSSKNSSLDIGALSLLSGVSPPAMDFQFSGINDNIIPARLNHFSSSFGDHSSNNNIIPPPFINLDSLGFNFPSMKQDHHQQQQLHGGLLSNFQEMGVPYNNNLHLNPNPTSNLASSIESLSSINQDLHWRLQQQRLATLLGGGGGGGESDQQQQQNQNGIESQTQKLQPILFHNLEIPKPSSMSSDLRKDGGGESGGGGLETEWFFDNNYSHVNVNPSTEMAAPTDDINTAGNYQIGSINNYAHVNVNIGMQAWNQFNQYSPLP